MSRDEAVAALHRALELSRELMAIADGGEMAEVLRLDAERRVLLKSARWVLEPMSQELKDVLRAIADVNARSIGRMEHRFRAKCRDMDMLAAGRRALLAYATTR